MTSNIYQKLNKIQTELKAPKGQMNKFGNYRYRSCEDIMEAVKPLCLKHGTVITITDDLVLIGERYYVKALAKLTDIETGSSTETVSFAREEEIKKGMDSSQITGSASSYARKYALNGLLAIDDTKDADATNKHDKEEESALDEVRMADKGQKETIVAGLGDKLQETLTKLKVANVDALTWEQAEKTIEWLSKRVKK